MKKYMIFIFALLLSCINTNNNEIDDKLQVYTSIYPIYDFAKKIGGNRVRVYNITANGSEPHDFEITSKDIVNLIKSDIFLYNGGGIEHWVDTVKDSIKDLYYVDTSYNLTNDTLDPHFWLSPINAIIQMENIKNAFIKIDSNNSNYYDSNFNLYSNHLYILDSRFRDNLSKVKNTNLVITHPAFGHFCKEYSLNQVAIARDDFDPKSMSSIIDFIKSNNIKALFYEEFSSSKLVDSIAKETSSTIYRLNPIESLSEEYINAGEDYFSIMEKNFISLTNGLNQ